MDISYIATIVLLILGFGFVVFWHELGHFIAAKWAGVKVEQFAIGFGHAICSWRQGMGWRWGSSGKEYEQMLRSDFAGAKVGETEYRLNWLPLGGYVKMLGQDDLKPGAVSDDPRLTAAALQLDLARLAGRAHRLQQDRAHLGVDRALLSPDVAVARRDFLEFGVRARFVHLPYLSQDHMQPTPCWWSTN